VGQPGVEDWRLVKEAFDALADGVFDLFGGDHVFENAEVDVDGDVLVGDVDGAFDRGAEESHFDDERKGEAVATPAALFLRELDGHGDGGFKDVVEGTIDGLLDVFFGTLVRDGDFQMDVPL
jgi:hypothetical protein